MHDKRSLVISSVVPVIIKSWSWSWSEEVYAYGIHTQHDCMSNEFDWLIIQFMKKCLLSYTSNFRYSLKWWPLIAWLINIKKESSSYNWAFANLCNFLTNFVAWCCTCPNASMSYTKYACMVTKMVHSTHACRCGLEYRCCTRIEAFNLRISSSCWVFANSFSYSYSYIQTFELAEMISYQL